MGVFTSEQLGLGRGAIAYRVKSQRLIRVLPAIYATEKPDYLDLCTAVTLWKPNAVLSHLTAAWLWDMIDSEPETISASVPPDSARRAPQWVRLFRRQLPEHSRRRGLPVVTRAQTFVDVAAMLHGSQLELFFDTAVRTPAERRELVTLCERSKGMAGMTALRQQLRRCVLNTRSEPERLVGRAMSARNFFMEINAQIGRYFGDFVDFRARVVVEIDGREFHISPDAFNNDRSRQNHLMLSGWLILRYSAVQVMANMDRVIDQIMAVVRRRRRSINACMPEWPFS
ncbi:DUF559 domain-containing protein [Rhodococcoides trifolii]|nr:DUF559 domain-containing protein [Rhodococcus trifolii]